MYRCIRVAGLDLKIADAGADIPRRSRNVFPILLVAVLSASPIGGLSVHRDWIVGCDNHHACHATTLDPEPSPEENQRGEELAADNAFGMAILRDGGPDDSPRIRFLPCYLCEPEDSRAPESIRRMRVADSAGKVFFQGALAAEDAQKADGEKGWTVPADAALLAALAGGEFLELQGETGQPLASISLRGLRDALHVMDADQHREGSTTALVARGTVASSALPAAVSEPPLRVPPRSSLPPQALAPEALKRLADTLSCDPSAPASPETFYERLDDRTTLLLLTTACSPYNGEGYVYLIDPAGLRPATVRLTPFDPPLDPPQLVSAYWDRSGRRLHSFARGRAFADCGEMQAFAWDGAQFLLVEQAEMGACRGSIDYISVYRRETAEGAMAP